MKNFSLGDKIISKIIVRIEYSREMNQEKQYWVNFRWEMLVLQTWLNFARLARQYFTIFQNQLGNFENWCFENFWEMSLKRALYRFWAAWNLHTFPHQMHTHWARKFRYATIFIHLYLNIFIHWTLLRRGVKRGGYVVVLTSIG